MFFHLPQAWWPKQWAPQPCRRALSLLQLDLVTPEGLRYSSSRQPSTKSRSRSLPKEAISSEPRNGDPTGEENWTGMSFFATWLMAPPGWSRRKGPETAYILLPTEMILSRTALLVPSSREGTLDLGPYWIEAQNIPEFDLGVSGFFWKFTSLGLSKGRSRGSFAELQAITSMDYIQNPCIFHFFCPCLLEELILLSPKVTGQKHLQKDLLVVLEAWLSLPFESFIKFAGMDLHWWKKGCPCPYALAFLKPSFALLDWWKAWRCLLFSCGIRPDLPPKTLCIAASKVLPKRSLPSKGTDNRLCFEKLSAD